MQSPAAIPSASRMQSSRIYVAPLLLLLTVLVLVVSPLQASSVATSTISISNLTITPSSGSVVFMVPWTAEAFDQAQNSLGDNQSQFNTSLGGIAQSSASVQFASAQSSADAMNMILMASAGVNIPGSFVAAASATARADIFNSTFMITGGTGSVNVTFGAMLNSLQSLMTDASGILASSEVVFALTIDGNVVLFLDSPNQIGPNSSLIVPIDQQLSNSMMLNYNQDYTIRLEADAENSGQNVPEPSTIALFFGGSALAFIRRLIPARRA